MVLRRPLRPQFAPAHDERIDLTADPRLLRSQQGRNPAQRESIIAGDDHHVHVARLCLLAPRERSEYECHRHLPGNRPERRPQPLAEAHRPHDDLLERLEDR